MNMQGKRGLIMGVANERSIAWGIARALSQAGADLAFTYQGEAFGKRLAPLAETIGATTLLDVDVTDDASLDAAFAELEKGDKLDFLIHAFGGGRNRRGTQDVPSCRGECPDARQCDPRGDRRDSPLPVFRRRGRDDGRSDSRRWRLSHHGNAPA